MYIPKKKEQFEYVHQIKYREIKPYWLTRLYQNDRNIIDIRQLVSSLVQNIVYLKAFIEARKISLKPYTHVRFTNGYPKGGVPYIEKEIVSITIGKPKEGLCPDKWLDSEFFIIKFK